MCGLDIDELAKLANVDMSCFEACHPYRSVWSSVMLLNVTFIPTYITVLISRPLPNLVIPI